MLGEAANQRKTDLRLDFEDGPGSPAEVQFLTGKSRPGSEDIAGKTQNGIARLTEHREVPPKEG